MLVGGGARGWLVEGGVGGSAFLYISGFGCISVKQSLSFRWLELGIPVLM